MLTTGVASERRGGREESLSGDSQQGNGGGQ